MELAAKEGSVAHLGDDALRPRGRVRRDGGIGVREVERTAVVDLGPADARNAALLQPLRAPVDEPEALHAAVLVGPLERELEAEADAEHRPSRVVALAQGGIVTALPQTCQRSARRADAGKDGEVRPTRVVHDLRAEAAEGDLDRAHVAGAVPADRDVHRSPFVDGRPAPSGPTGTGRPPPAGGTPPRGPGPPA